jgi:uncharacterized protein YkwD
MKKTLKKYFVPHPENDHKPHILREKAVFVMAIITIVLFFASFLGNRAVKNIKSLAAIQSAFLVDLANEDRADLGLSQLAINDKLVNAATLKASDMAEKSYFAHISPEGKTPWYWIQKAGYSYVHAGENLAVNFEDSEDVERAWMNSPTHKANILSNKYTEIGISTAVGTYKGERTTFVVQMFGSPKKTVAQNIENSLSTKVAEASEVKSSGEVNEQVVEQTNVLAATPEASVVEEGNFMSFVNPEATPEELNQVEVSNSDEKVTYTNWFERMLVSPTVVVSNLYVVLMALIIFSLVLKIFIEIRLQHPKNIAYGIILLGIVLVFMYLNNNSAEPIVVVMN